MEEAIDWKVEANHIINDVKNHVKNIEVSERLVTDIGVYINILTQEERSLCVLLNNSGFKIVGSEYDSCDDEDNSENEVYETIYALVQKHSPAYTQSFGQELVDKLSKVES